MQAKRTMKSNNSTIKSIRVFKTYLFLKKLGG